MKKEKMPSKKKIFGLLGRDISYSFSSGYFKEKFADLHLKNYEYHNFDIQNIKDFPSLISGNIEGLKGMNVTIPYKQTVFEYLDEIDEEAKNIGAVNTIVFSKSGKLKGYNTDVFGFQKSIEPLLQKQHTKALILGTGGAAKAIAFVLGALKIDFLYVSRDPQQKNEISYESLNEVRLKEHQLIINCTPLGTFSQTEKYPDIPYQFIEDTHLLFDLTYNPSVTKFLKKGKDHGATTKNGLEMLQLQAEKSWEIWNR